MPNNDFVKGECRHCGGHLEFPTDATGQSIPCPHCGQLTELRPGVAKKRSLAPALVAVAAVVAIGLAGAAVVFFKGRGSESSPATTAPAPPARPAPVAVALAKPAPPLKPGEVQTNDFDISPVTLQKMEGSSLVYVVGRVKNLAAKQRFGVKVEFALFNTNDAAIGTATDYQQIMETNGYWDFKAMVMESKTVSAKFSAILEDQ